MRPDFELAIEILRSQPREPNLVALEGLPCAGKTTLAGEIGALDERVGVIPELHPTCPNPTACDFLALERERKRLASRLGSKRLVVMDRSILSTLVIESAKGRIDDNFLVLLRSLAAAGEIRLPHLVLLLDISPAESARRQARRDRSWRSLHRWSIHLLDRVSVDYPRLISRLDLRSRRFAPNCSSPSYPALAKALSAAQWG